MMYNKIDSKVLLLKACVLLISCRESNFPITVAHFSQCTSISFESSMKLVIPPLQSLVYISSSTLLDLHNCFLFKHMFLKHLIQFGDSNYISRIINNYTF